MTGGGARCCAETCGRASHDGASAFNERDLLGMTIGALVFAATGRFFGAGGDVTEMTGFGGCVATGIKRLADDLQRTVSTLSRMKLPLIVAANGVAAAQGSASR